MAGTAIFHKGGVRDCNFQNPSENPACSDPRDRIVYPIQKLMIDSYYLLDRCGQSSTFNPLMFFLFFLLFILSKIVAILAIQYSLVFFEILSVVLIEFVPFNFWSVWQCVGICMYLSLNELTISDK